MPLFGFLCAAVLPVALWHHAIGAVAEDFRLEPGYLTGWSGFGLIALGLVLMLPLVVSARPRFRNVYMGWGVSLYVLGLALASQVAAAVG
jgi:hypothetical protein